MTHAHSVHYSISVSPNMCTVVCAVCNAQQACAELSAACPRMVLGGVALNTSACRAIRSGHVSSVQGGNACTWLLPPKRLPLHCTPLHKHYRGVVTSRAQQCAWSGAICTLRPAHAAKAACALHPRATGGCLAVTVSCYMHATCGVHGTCLALAFVCCVIRACRQFWPATPWDMPNPFIQSALEHTLMP